MTEKRTMPYVDILKFVFAILIFLLHNGMFSLIPYYSVIQVVTVRLAVPFFFVASGFFFANKLILLQNKTEKKEAIYEYCKRLGTKLLVFEPISIIILVAGRLVVEHMALPQIAIITIKEILFYPRGALWFIQALIVSSILLFPIINTNKEFVAIIPAIVLYIIALLGNRYYFLIEGTIWASLIDRYESIFITVRNGLFEGFPFMLCGCLIARKQGIIKEWKRGTLVFLFAISFFVVFLESILLRHCSGHDDNSLYLSYLISVPVLFVAAAFFFQNNRFGRKTIVYRNLSTSIYLLHSPICRIVEIAMSFVMKENILINGIISAALIGIICLFVYKNRFKPFYGWLV